MACTSAFRFCTLLMKYDSYARLWQQLKWFFLLCFAAYRWIVANGPNFIKTFILTYDFLCRLAHRVKKIEFLSACFTCIAFCLECWAMAFEKFQISFSASEGALFSFLFLFVFFFSVFCNAKLVNPSKFYVHNDAKWVKFPLFLIGFSFSLSFKVCGLLIEN